MNFAELGGHAVEYENVEHVRRGKHDARIMVEISHLGQQREEPEDLELPQMPLMRDGGRGPLHLLPGITQLALLDGRLL